MTLQKCLLALVLCLAWTGIVRAQTDPTQRRTVIGDSRGRDFWLAFPRNAQPEKNTGLQLRLFITSDRATKGTVSIPGTGFRRAFAIGATEITSIDLDSTIQIMTSEEPVPLAVHVEADNDIAVYGLSSRKASTDSYLAFPTNVLGTTYRAMGYYPLAQNENQFTSQFTVIATQDNTNLNITLTGDTRGGKRAGQTFTVKLNQGEVYQVMGLANGRSRSDLTGSLVTSDKPVAFITGHTCAQIPAEVMFCDVLLEMVPPVPSWGRQFYLGRFESRTEYVFRVMASEANTQVFVNNVRVANLQAGEFYENNHARENALITSSKPVLVAQYAQSSDADSLKVGDPFMMLITPTEQFLNYYRFLTPVRGEWHHYINLVVPTDGISSLRLDGRAVPPRIFRQIGLSKFAVGQYEIGFGSHSVSCDKPFGLYSYGFGVGTDNYDSYGNGGGQLVETVPLTPDTLRPLLELVSEDGEASLRLIARDDRLFDFGLKSITVIDSDNFRSPVVIPAFDVGTPQVALTFRIRDTSQCGFMSLKVSDAANNDSYWVVCRTKLGARWIYSIQEGRDNLCPSCRSWTVQFIATPAYTVSTVDFEKPSYLGGSGEYKDFRSRLSGGFTGMYIFPFTKEIALAGGVGYNSITGAAVSHHTSFQPDSILYGLAPGAQRSKTIEDFVAEMSVSYVTVNGGLYYYFVPEQVYLYSGIAGGFLVGSSLVQNAQLLYPATLEYQVGRSGGARQKLLYDGDLPKPTPFHLALELSPGVQFKLSQRIALLAGAYMNLPFFDAVKDLNWHLTTFGLRLGLQYRN